MKGLKIFMIAASLGAGVYAVSTLMPKKEAKTTPPIAWERPDGAAAEQAPVLRDPGLAITRKRPSRMPLASRPRSSRSAFVDGIAMGDWSESPERTSANVRASANTGRLQAFPRGNADMMFEGTIEEMAAYQKAQASGENAHERDSRAVAGKSGEAPPVEEEGGLQVNRAFENAGAIESRGGGGGAIGTGAGVGLSGSGVAEDHGYVPQEEGADIDIPVGVDVSDDAALARATEPEARDSGGPGPGVADRGGPNTASEDGAQDPGSPEKPTFDREGRLKIAGSKMSKWTHSKKSDLNMDAMALAKGHGAGGGGRRLGGAGMKLPKGKPAVRDPGPKPVPPEEEAPEAPVAPSKPVKPTGEDKGTIMVVLDVSGSMRRFWNSGDGMRLMAMLNEAGVKVFKYSSGPLGGTDAHTAFQKLEKQLGGLPPNMVHVTDGGFRHTSYYNGQVATKVPEFIASRSGLQGMGQLTNMFNNEDRKKYLEEMKEYEKQMAAYAEKKAEYDKLKAQYDEKKSEWDKANEQYEAELACWSKRAADGSCTLIYTGEKEGLFLVVHPCPEGGWRQVKSDWPKEGDYACVMGDPDHPQAAGVFVKTDDMKTPYKWVASCPGKTKAEASGRFPAADKLCQ